jgi:hypothetical protein
MRVHKIHKKLDNKLSRLMSTTRVGLSITYYSLPKYLYMACAQIIIECVDRYGGRE